MPLIRTVFQPDSPREVDDHEAAQLEREGLLLALLPEQQDAPSAPKPGPSTAVTPTPAKEVVSDGGKQA